MAEYGIFIRIRKDWAMSPWRLAFDPRPIPTTPFGTYKAGRGGWASWAMDYTAPSYRQLVTYPEGRRGRKYWRTSVKNYDLKRRNLKP